MRQYLKKHIEIIVLAIALICAMVFQYIRIASLDIAFLFETGVNTILIYIVVMLAIPLVLFVYFVVPLFFVFEVSCNIKLLNINIPLHKVLYSIKPVNSYVFSKSHLNTVLRC